MINRINELSSLWADQFLLASLQNTVFISLILLLLYLLRHKDARLLRGIAIIGIIKLLIPPFFTVAFIEKSFSGNAVLAELGSFILPGVVNSAEELTRSQPGLTAQSFWMISWFTIFVVILSFTAVRIYRLRKLFIHAEPVDVTSYVTDENKSIVYLKSCLNHSPLVYGFLRHNIILPQCWDRWSDDCKRSVLAHETAHIKHGDHWINLMQALVQAVHFFNPLIWLLNRKLDKYCEMVSDDAAVKTAGLTSTGYSDNLLSVAKTIYQTWQVKAKTAFAESPSRLKERVYYQIERSDKKEISETKYSIAVILLIAMILPFSWYFSVDGKTGEESHDINKKNVIHYWQKHEMFTTIDDNSKVVYVSELTGSDETGNGTKEYPFKTLNRALEMDIWMKPQ